MKEKKKQAEGQVNPATITFDTPSIPPPPPAPVFVSSGPYAENIPAGGMTVGGIREKFADRFDIDEEAQAVVNGVAVDNDTVVPSGQSLMFIRPAGEKGQE